MTGFAMRCVQALNAVSSQVWAVLLMLSGVGTLMLANFGHTTQVVSALLGAGGSMVGGALILFQHQAKETQDSTQVPSPGTDTTAAAKTEEKP